MKKKPCKECPFRKNSSPGWLGELSYRPDVYINGLEHTIIPCHMKVDWDEAEERNVIVDGEENPCIGALQFCANSLKYPRGARMEGTTYNALISSVKPNPDVFKWGGEFIKHHSAPSTTD